jgi:Uncharacterized conserved protein
MSIPQRAAALGMAPHPEGGWFVRTWTANEKVATQGGPRPAATLIHYLLEAGQASAWHLVTSDEVWLWHGPGSLELQLGGSGEAPLDGPRFRLGGGAEEVAQVLVPAGTWQRSLPAAAEVLVSCLVSPGFDYADWTLLEG